MTTTKHEATEELIAAAKRLCEQLAAEVPGAHSWPAVTYLRGAALQRMIDIVRERYPDSGDADLMQTWLNEQKRGSDHDKQTQHDRNHAGPRLAGRNE